MRSVTSPLTSINAVTIKSSLASSRANCLLLTFICFFIVLFIAPVMPELHFEPKPIAVTNRIAMIFQRRGAGLSVLVSELSSLWDWTAAEAGTFESS